MSNRKYDNERDRFDHGFDAGQIVDGTVVLDDVTNRLVLEDEDGVCFDVQAALQTLVGKKIRLTVISFESIENIESMMKKIQVAQS